MKWLCQGNMLQCPAHIDAESPPLGRALCFALHTRRILPVLFGSPETQKKLREPKSNYKASALSGRPAHPSSATLPQHKTFHSQKRFYEFPGVARAWQTLTSSPPPTMVSGASSLSSAQHHQAPALSCLLLINQTNGTDNRCLQVFRQVPWEGRGTVVQVFPSQKRATDSL